MSGATSGIAAPAYRCAHAGYGLNGAAIIEAETTTVLVDTGDSVTVNALGWLDIKLR
jgi:N-methylhydantoinase A